MDQILQQFRREIVDASLARRPLQLRGGGSKDWYGQAPQGAVFDTRRYAGITVYEPSELVITARCGTPLAEIERTLAAHGQMLAFEPPHFGADATLGGMVASGLSGPRRASAGAVRDFVLGTVLMNGHGEILHFGGQVMKNVAGYDVSRLLAGSLGVLGLILEVSLKVMPRPAADCSLSFEMAQEPAIECMNRWSGQPLPMVASAWCDGQLHVRLAGAQAAVAAAQSTLGGERMQDADRFWHALREQTHAFFAGDAPLWRLSLPATTPPFAVPGAPEATHAQLIEWGGAQRWLRGDLDPPSLRAAVARLGGHAALFRGGDKRLGVFHPLAPAVARIHRRLKTAFDPAGIFNPGRMYVEL